MHAGPEDEAQNLLRAVQREVEPVTDYLCRFDAAMIVHTGLDVAGLAWWWDTR